MQTKLNISYPIQLGDYDGYFGNDYTTIDKYKSTLKLLLQTEPNDRFIGSIQYGTPLKQFLFEFPTDELSDNIKNTIINSINRFIPEITILDLSVDIRNFENYNRNLLLINLKFNVYQQQSELTISI